MSIHRSAGGAARSDLQHENHTIRFLDAGDAVYLTTAVEHLHPSAKKAPVIALDLKLATGLRTPQEQPQDVIVLWAVDVLLKLVAGLVALVEQTDVETSEPDTSHDDLPLCSSLPAAV